MSRFHRNGSQPHGALCHSHCIPRGRHPATDLYCPILQAGVIGSSFSRMASARKWKSISQSLSLWECAPISPSDAFKWKIGFLASIAIDFLPNFGVRHRRRISSRLVQLLNSAQELLKILWCVFLSADCAEERRHVAQQLLVF